MDVVKRRNPHIKILKDIKQRIEPINEAQTGKELLALLKRADLFIEHLNALRVPSRFAIMALLSQQKVSIFNDSLIQLMEMLMFDHWNRRDDAKDG